MRVHHTSNCVDNITACETFPGTRYGPVKGNCTHYTYKSCSSSSSSSSTSSTSGGHTTGPVTTGMLILCRGNIDLTRSYRISYDRLSHYRTQTCCDVQPIVSVWAAWFWILTRFFQIRVQYLQPQFVHCLENLSIATIKQPIYFHYHFWYLLSLMVAICMKTVLGIS
jgi:hypothetical protein